MLQLPGPWSSCSRWWRASQRGQPGCPPDLKPGHGLLGQGPWGGPLQRGRCSLKQGQLGWGGGGPGRTLRTEHTSPRVVAAAAPPPGGSLGRHSWQRCADLCQPLSASLCFCLSQAPVHLRPVWSPDKHRIFWPWALFLNAGTNPRLPHRRAPCQFPGTHVGKRLLRTMPWSSRPDAVVNESN